MKIGVRGHDLGIQDNISVLASKTKTMGFDFIQLVPKKILRNESCILNDELVHMIRNEFKKHNIEIALLGAYFNPIHSNEDKVKLEVEEFKAYLNYSNQFGCQFVGTETGSFNDDSWTYHPNNHSDEAFNKVVTVVKELAQEAEKCNAYVAIEPAYNHVVYCPTRLKQLIDEVNSDHLVVIIDLYNLLNSENYLNYKTIFAEYITTFKEKIKIFHFKDFIYENDDLIRVGLGEGMIDFDYIIKLINEHLPDSIAVFEGVPEDKLPTSLAHIKTIDGKFKL